MFDSTIFKASITALFCTLAISVKAQEWTRVTPIADRLIKDTSFELVDSGNGLKYVIPEDAAFKKHRYSEWHYANGVTLDGLLELAKVSGESRYRRHVETFCRTTLNNRKTFEKEYLSGNGYSQNYRMFRRDMFDNTTAPALPFLDLLIEGRLGRRAEKTVLEMADYAMHGQYRLQDGTFVRPEPEWTIWCDDAFMACSFLSRMYEWTGDETFIDECARQLLAYDRYLRDSGTGLMNHGWDDVRKVHVGRLWGRANGWFAWACSDVLERMSQDHPSREALLELHISHLKALAAVQRPSGMLCQILTDAESYEETSATAILCLTLVRAIRHEWIGREFEAAALAAWDGVCSKIDEGGVIHGICRSMDIGDTDAHYLTRPTADNDPRGLGAVFMAGVEISKFNR